ncbi:MAG: hypothetical protein H7A45_10360 [Verrucomicrobiales bacterium]|nr:hypothetical protein [Verrucomicrobiales bacterium]MCP5528225.1 hypothetical protein [Verrucomicrobiales bacterium]
MKPKQIVGKAKGPERVTVGSVTVRIYPRTKPAGYVAYEAADYSLGRRRLRSFADHAKARREAERIAGLMAAWEATAAQIRGPEAASYGRAVELPRPTGDALELVASRYDKAVKPLGDGSRIAEAVRFFLARNPDTLPQKTVAETVDELLVVKEGRGRSGRYLADLRARLRRFADSFHVGIADVTT